MLLKHFGIANEDGGNAVENKTVSGEICIGLGNIAAIAINKRAAGTGRDLNRSFIQKELDAHRGSFHAFPNNALCFGRYLPIVTRKFQDMSIILAPETLARDSASR